MFKQLGCLHVLLNYGADVNITDKEVNQIKELEFYFRVWLNWP
jgi:hypothetical protein